MKFDYITMALCILSGTMAITGCEKYDELFAEQYHRVLNIKNGGIRNIDLYTINATDTIPVSVMKTGSEASISANGMLATMNEADFLSYCTDNDLNYTIIPSDYYILSNNDLSFADTERYKMVNAVLKVRELKKLMDSNPDKHYALPLVLRSMNATVNDSLLIIDPNVIAPTIGFTSAGYVSAASFTPSGESTASMNIQVDIPVENQWGLTCTIASDETARKSFEAFNAQNGNRYTLLPSAAYTMESEGVITFGEGTKSATLKLTFNRDKISVGEYILPVSISKVGVDGFVLDSGRNIMLLGVSYMPQEVKLSADMFHANSIQQNDGAGYTGLIDGLGSGKHFHSNYSSPVKDEQYGNYIDVNLKSPLKTIKFDYWTRYDNPNQGPTHLKIFVSSDGTKWTLLDDITSGLPSGANQKYSSKIYTAPESFTKFRFAVLQSLAGNMVSGGGFFSLGELTLYGN